MNLWDRLEELERQNAELHRKLDTIVRVGVVKDVKDGAYVVDAGFDTHQLDHAQHGGHGKDHRPLKKGQQVTLLCPGGDISNACIIPGGYHDGNPAPATDDASDIIGERAGARLRTKDGEAALEALSSAVRVVDGVIHLDAKSVVVGGPITGADGKVVLGGQIYLGGAGAARPVSGQGSVDTRGDAQVGNLSPNVFVT